MYYRQEKLNPSKQLNSICELNLVINSSSIIYKGDFYMEFKKDEVPYGVTFSHILLLNKENGDIFVTYEINNKKYDDGSYKNISWTKKNNFDKLYDLTTMGFYRGEKRRGFWGAKYNKVITQFFNAIKKDLCREFEGTFLEKKDYWEDSSIDVLYDLVVDYHLYKKKIKFHDNVYNHIMTIFPKRKWLKLNDNKFLPAVLEEHKIKSKYLIKELSISDWKSCSKVNIRGLIYLCNLFGENYIDYIKKFDWKKISSEYFDRTKKHTCKNESEKRTLVHIFKTHHTLDPIKMTNTLESLYNLFEVRNFLEHHGYKNLKLKIKSIDDINLQLECWLMLKRHLTIGYMTRYKIPENIISDIEEPIEYDGEIFRPKVLLTNDDFCIEGLIMKNCMAKQFIHGSIFIFLSLSNSKKRVNIQYRGGSINMAFGKANSPIPEGSFKEVINILTDRMLKHKNISWKKERYNILPT